MPRNGSGTYSLPAGNPVVTGTVISSTVQNTTMSDVATALTQSIASTGVTTPVANLPMGTYRHTGVGNATAKACYSSVTDIQNGSLVTLGAVSGADTITASAPFTLSSYAAGQGFRFVADGTNTGAVTINIDGLGAKSITKNGSDPLGVGDIPLGKVVEIVYDGTQFQYTNVSSSNPAVVMQTFTTSGTYTPTSGMQYCIVHMVGGGAGGTQNSSGSYGGGGGGAGEYATGVFSAAAIGASKTVTIGAGGAVTTAGGTTSLGTLLTAVGGGAGTVNSYTPGAGGTGGTGTGLHVPGGQGATGSGVFSGPQFIGGSGGASFFGSGGRGGVGNLDNGTAGTAYGSGGGGNGNVGGVWAAAGAGASGCVIIYEYF